MKILKQRSEKVEQQQLESAELTKKGEVSANESKQTLLNAKKEAVKIIADAKKQAETDAAAILSKAKAEAKLLAESENKATVASIENDRQSVIANLAQLVTDTTSQVLGDALSAQDQHKIIASQLKVIKGVSLE